MDDVSCLQTPRDRVQCLDFGRQFSTLQVSFNASGIDIFSSSTLSVFFSLSRLDPPRVLLFIPSVLFSSADQPGGVRTLTRVDIQK